MTVFDDAEKNWQLALDVLRPSQKDLEHGLELHRNSFVFDSYGFMPTGGGKCERADRLIREHASRSEIKYAIENFRQTGSMDDPETRRRLKEAWEFAGVDCVFQNCGEESNDIEILIRRLSSFINVTDKLDGFYERAAYPEQLEKIRERGNRSLYITANGVPLANRMISAEETLMYIEMFFNFGVRMMHFTYNRRNLLGDGCFETADAGLSDLGKMAIKEMNRVGVIPDIAHSGQRTSLEAALCSEKPVVASHAVAGKLSDHCRSKCDEVIEAVKRTNGYIGICAIPAFLQGSMMIDSFIDHIDYVARTFGVDHVAIGTDNPMQLGAVETEEKAQPARPGFEQYKGSKKYAVSTQMQYNCMSWSNWPLFTVGLVQRGYSDKDIQKIIGGNVLRVCRETLA